MEIRVKYAAALLSEEEMWACDAGLISALSFALTAAQTDRLPELPSETESDDY